MREKAYPFTETGLWPKVKTFPPTYEYEWAKVVRERKEGQAKFLGGHYLTTPKILVDKK